MHNFTELEMYEELGRAIGRIRGQLPQQSDAYRKAADEAVFSLHEALYNQKNYLEQNPQVTSQQRNPFVMPIYDAVKAHANFWRMAGMPADIVNDISNQRPLNQLLGAPELNAQNNNLLNNAALISMRQAKAIAEYSATPPEGVTAHWTHRYLTSPADFVQEARTYRFDTDQDKARLRKTMLNHWLSIQIATYDFDASKQPLLDIVNATDNLVRDKLRSFAKDIPDNAPPNQRIDPALYSELGDDAAAKLRMKILEKIVKSQTDIATLQRLVNGEDSAWKDMGVTNTSWMTVENGKAIKDVVEERINILEQDPQKIDQNIRQFESEIDRFMRGDGQANRFTQNQVDALKNIFQELTVTEQKLILEKCQGSSHFFARVFNAKTPEALKYHLGLKTSSDISDNSLQWLTQYAAMNSIMSGELARHLIDNNKFPDPALVNDALQLCYPKLVDQNATQQSDTEAFEAMEDAIGVKLPQQQLLGSLKKSAEIHASLGEQYNKHKSFCNYFLSLPEFSKEFVVYHRQQAGAPQGKTIGELTSDLIDIFQNAATLTDFKAGISGTFSPEVVNCFINMQESDFRELKNSTLKENLTALSGSGPVLLEKKSAEILKRSHEQILKPLRDDFRLTQKSLVELSERMLEVRKLVRADMGVKQVASSHKDELKRDLLRMIEIGQKMDQKLSRDITKLYDYRSALLKAASEGNIETPALQQESEKVSRHIQELEKSRDAWKKFRENTGLITKEELNTLQEQQPFEAHHSVYVDITSAERESARAEGPRFPFTARKTTFKAVDVEGYRAPDIPEKDVTNKVIVNREKYSLTKEKDYVPVLKPGQMHEMRVPYIDKRNEDRIVEQTLVFTKKSHGDGRFTTSLQRPGPLTPEGMLEMISLAEWTIASQKRGSTFELRGQVGYVSQMYKIFTDLGVPPSLIDIDKSVYDPKNPSPKAIEAEKALTSIDGYQERIDKSKERIITWRKDPAAHIHNRSVKAKGLLQGIIADSEAKMNGQDNEDYIRPTPHLPTRSS